MVEDLNSRQEVLDAMVDMLPDDIQTVDTNVTDSSDETAETVEQIGAMFPSARGLAEIEARQLAFVENLTRFADWRARRAEVALRKLNLDPGAMAAATRAELESAMGGPLEVLSTSADGSLDPRFERLRTEFGSHVRSGTRIGRRAAGSARCESSHNFGLRLSQRSVHPARRNAQRH